MELAPPVLPEIASPPPVPPKPWNALATLGLSAAVEMAVILLQAAVVMVVTFCHAMQGRPFNLNEAAYDGDSWSLAMLPALPLGFGLCVLFAQLRKGPPVGDYLALRGFRWHDFWLGLAALVGLQTAAELLQIWLGHPPNAEMLHVYESARWPAFLWFTVVVAAPLQEEVLFRGFLFRGLAASRLGWLGATLISALGWTALHVQYDWLELLNIFALGLLLGWVRHRSGSLWLTIVLHAINNLVATVWIVWLIHGQK